MTVLRPFKVFGPRQSTRAIIPTIIGQYMQNQDFLNLGLMTPTRDFNYVQDTVNAFCKCIDAKNISGEIINIGSGKEFSIKVVAELIASYFGKKLKVKLENKRIRPKKSEVLRLCSSTKKSKKILNWTSSIKGKKQFKDKLYKTIDWYIENKNLIKINSKKYHI